MKSGLSMGERHPDEIDFATERNLSVQVFLDEPGIY